MRIETVISEVAPKFVFWRVMVNERVVSNGRTLTEEMAKKEVKESLREIKAAAKERLKGL